MTYIGIKRRGLAIVGGWLTTLVLITSSLHAQDAASPLKVAATVPELGSLARQVGGDQVEVTVFAKGTEDPHFVEAKPSFVKALSQADLFMQVGMDNEMGWAPLLLQNAGNPSILPGAKGYLDTSTVITPLDVPTGTVDRSRGDVHAAETPII